MARPELGSLLSHAEQQLLTQGLHLLLSVREHIPADTRPDVEEVQDLLERINQPAQDPKPVTHTGPAAAQGTLDEPWAINTVTGTVTGPVVQVREIRGGVHF
jgi:hypothetical protein